MLETLGPSTLYLSPNFWSRIFLIFVDSKLAFSKDVLLIKILQILFASQSQKKSDVQKQLNDNLKLLHNSIDATYNLYVYLLYLISNVTSYAEQLIDEGKNKLLPTEEERNPNMRFVQNKFALQIQENIAKFHILSCTL